MLKTSYDIFLNSISISNERFDGSDPCLEAMEEEEEMELDDDDGESD